MSKWAEGAILSRCMSSPSTPISRLAVCSSASMTRSRYWTNCTSI